MRAQHSSNRGSAMVAVCVAASLLALLLAGLALWRSHEALSSAKQAQRVSGNVPEIKETLESMLQLNLAAEPIAEPEVKVPATATKPAVEAKIVVPAKPSGDAVLAMNGQPVLAQEGDGTKAVQPPKHKWDGPSAPAPEPGAIISWQEAGGHYSRTITVEGLVKQTSRSRSGSLVYLNFQPYEPGSDAFYIAVFEGGYSNAPDGDPQAYYLNKRIRVTGQVSQHRDRPQIKVERPGMIEVVE